MKLLKILGGAFFGLVAVIVLIALGAYIADPAVVRNLLSGPSVGNSTQTERSNPKEAVPGIERDDIPTAPNEFIDPVALAAAQAYADETQSVAMIIYQRGAIRFERYWPGYTRDFLTDPFSAHKSVLGLLVGAAIADGLIRSVDEPAANYLPEWAGDARKDITIRHLLQMSSGLTVPRFGVTWTSWRITLGSDLAGTALGLALERPPGADFQYNNSNSQALGIILQRASGRRYSQYLSERLWSRIGAPTAYTWLDRQGGMPRTFCCLYTTARGWLHVGRLILERGRIGEAQVIPAEWIEAMTTPAATNPNYGYQIWLGSPPGTERKYNDKTVRAYHSEPFVAQDMIFIDGFGGQRVYIVPSEQLIIVRTGMARIDWDDARIPNAILRGIRRQVDQP
jgi:CubicO group peptidase (beta-lactamase class C family)